MIKYNGQGLADIKYNGSSIKRVMKDGVQIWPDDSGVPNIPTGIQLSEYDIVDTLEIPTGITLREVLEPTYTYLLDDYPGAAAAYSLRKLRTGVVQGIMVRRDSDDQLVDVRLYDDPSKSIDLDSITESGGQTLGEWVGSASAYIFNWYDQSGNGNHASQFDEDNQPRIINAGVLELLEGKTSIYANTSYEQFMSAPFTNTFTGDTLINMDCYALHNIIPLSGISGNKFSVSGIHPSVVSTDRRQVLLARNDASIQMLLNGGNSIFNYSISGRILNTFYRNGANTDFLVRSNGIDLALTSSGATKSLNMQSDSAFTIYKPNGIGYEDTSTNMSEGKIQEIIYYFNDQSANRTAIEANINDFYNIYVVTAEVDAQLIQADNDNVSDTIIEINGVRSSASDTAVANLISRNVTVITS